MLAWLTFLLFYNLFQFKWFVNHMFIQLLNSATFPMWTSLLKIGVRYIPLGYYSSYLCSNNKNKLTKY